jgi:hypothetical protein
MHTPTSASMGAQSALDLAIWAVRLIMQAPDTAAECKAYEEITGRDQDIIAALRTLRTALATEEVSTESNHDTDTAVTLSHSEWEFVLGILRTYQDLLDSSGEDSDQQVAQIEAFLSGRP